MPNYKLSPNIVNHMISVGNMLCERRVSHMQSGFPISRDKIQQAILPAKWREVVMEMAAEQINALHKTQSVITAMPQSSVGAQRAALLLLELGRGNEVFYCYEINGGNAWYATEAFTKDQRHVSAEVEHLWLDTQVLTPDEWEALVKWTNTAVQERRLANLAKRTIKTFMETEAFSRTSGHILARWPALTTLTTLIDPKISRVYYSERDRENITGWRTKFSEPVRNLKPYGWPLGDPWFAKNQKAMRLTETVIASAQLLPDKVDDPAEVKASVVSWRPLPGDLDKP